MYISINDKLINLKKVMSIDCFRLYVSFKFSEKDVIEIKFDSPQESRAFFNSVSDFINSGHKLRTY